MTKLVDILHISTSFVIFINSFYYEIIKGVDENDKTS